MIESIVPVLLFVGGLALGYRLPDVDVTPVLPLKHRSAWTHGPLLALAAWWLAGLFPAYGLFFGGATAAIAMHLLEDVNPRKWAGSALVNMFPIPISLPAPLSALYIGASVLATVWILMQILEAL